VVEIGTVLVCTVVLWAGQLDTVAAQDVTVISVVEYSVEVENSVVVENEVGEGVVTGATVLGVGEYEKTLDCVLT